MSHKWGLVVDLDRCTGCEACVVACHAENNVPTAGADQAARGRTMQWIRVERTWEGDFPNPKVRFQPVLCQQCDNAPCEPVCPTYASYHTPEGLNAQVYNRCIARVFAPMPARTPCARLISSIRSGRCRCNCNSIRMFCAQCGRDGEVHLLHAAHQGGRDWGGGGKAGAEGWEFTTACAQSCASKALIFGDLNNPDSEVARLASSNRSTKLLGELGTKPNVTYLERGTWQDAKNS